MKSIITFILILTVSFVQAQSNAATPNAGFEDWTNYSCTTNYDNPDSGWATLNPTLCTLGYTLCIKDATNPHSGLYDAELITENVIIQVAPSPLTTGAIITSNKTIDGGRPYTLRPDSMIGWYHYVSVSGDNGDCEFYLFGANHSDTIGKAFFKTPTSTVANWTRFSLPITYLSPNTPDTALWIFSSSLSNTSNHAGSELFIDDIGLVMKNTSGINNPVQSELLTVGPNPTPGLITINNDANLNSLTFTLTDIAGRKIEENKLTTGTNTMELKVVASGIYLYTVTDAQNLIVKTGKIVVQK